MTSKVDVANAALIKIGASTISSFDDNTTEAIAIKSIYDEVVEEVISEGLWSTAVSRATLAQTTNTPAYDYTYEYQLPTSPKCLKVIDINEATDSQVSYAVEGDKLLSDSTTMKIKYLGVVEDPNDYGPYLRRAIVSRLAYELALTLTSSASTSQRFLQIYEVDVAKGLAKDGRQGTSLELGKTRVVEDR